MLARGLRALGKVRTGCLALLFLCALAPAPQAQDEEEYADSYCRGVCRAYCEQYCAQQGMSCKALIYCSVTEQQGCLVGGFCG